MKLSYQKVIHPQLGPITKFTVKSTLTDPQEDLRYYFYITLPFLKLIPQPCYERHARSLGSQTPINTFLHTAQLKKG